MMGATLAILATAHSLPLRTSTRMVYVQMGLHAMDNTSKRYDPYRLPGVYYDGVDELAATCFPNMTLKNGRRAVYKALAELQSKGLITPTKSAPGRGQPQAYQLNLPGYPADEN